MSPVWCPQDIICRHTGLGAKQNRCPGQFLTPRGSVDVFRYSISTGLVPHRSSNHLCLQLSFSKHGIPQTTDTPTEYPYSMALPACCLKASALKTEPPPTRSRNANSLPASICSIPVCIPQLCAAILSQFALRPTSDTCLSSPN